MVVSLKVVVIGDKSVGKSSLVTSFLTNAPAQEPIQNIKNPKPIATNNKDVEIHLQLIDTDSENEEERVESYEGANLFLICFSLADASTFSQIETKWQKELRLYTAMVPTVLVGCKSDLKSVVDAESIDKLKQELDALTYVSCSALTFQGINEVFEEVIARFDPQEPEPEILDTISNAVGMYTLLLPRAGFKPSPFSEKIFSQDKLAAMEYLQEKDNIPAHMLVLVENLFNHLLNVTPSPAACVPTQYFQEFLEVLKNQVLLEPDFVDELVDNKKIVEFPLAEYRDEEDKIYVILKPIVEDMRGSGFIFGLGGYTTDDDEKIPKQISYEFKANDSLVAFRRLSGRKVPVKLIYSTLGPVLITPTSMTSLIPAQDRYW